MTGDIVRLRAGSPPPQIGSVLEYELGGWFARPKMPRAHNATHTHTDTIVHIVMGVWQSPDFVSGVTGWKFSHDGSLEANNITARGTITATAGSIGGWTIAADNLYAGSGANRAGLAPDTYPFYAGHNTPASAPFRVTAAGGLVATSATITGSITATTGAIGGWDITATEIKNGANIILDSSVPSIVIGTTGYIRSSDYASGIEGFHIDDNFAEFGNVQVRGSLHCAVFVKDLISAHAGSLLVTKSAGKLDADYTVGGNLTVETPPEGSWLFDDNDIVRIKEEYASGVYESWVVVTRTGTTNVYTTSLSSGDDTSYHQGVTAVDYGVSGDGGLLQTADMANAPWLSVFTHAGAPWTTLTHHLRLGNLNGVADIASDLYGIFIGDYAGDKWMSYDPTNSLRIRGDALIDGTITADKLYMGIGETLFSKTDGLLLLGPDCEINATEWWSLRGQKATMSGAFHQEAGRWLGTRALVVEPGTTNYCPYSSFESWSGGRPTGWTIYNAPTETQETAIVRYGSSSYRIVTDQGGDMEGAYQDITGLTPTSTYTITCWMYGISGTCRFSACDGGGFANPVHSNVVGYGVWTRAELEKVCPAGGSIRVVLSNWVVGNHEMIFDAVQVELGSQPSSYTYYDMGTGYSGTEAGTSVRAATTVTIPTSGNIGADEGYISMRFKVPEWNPNGGFLWCAGNVNIEFDAYLHPNGTIVYCLNGSPRCGSASGAATVDVWHHVVFNWKVSTDISELYLDGALVDTNTCGGATPTLHASLGIGYSPLLGTSYNLLGLVSEFATGKTMLTTSQVAAIYALQLPLTDAGALDSPGIYILDGRMRFASSLTGNRLEINADYIAGYSDATTKEFYIQASDGQAMCGGGVVGLGGGGIAVTMAAAYSTIRAYKFIMADETVAGGLSGWEAAGTNTIQLKVEKVTDYISHLDLLVESDDDKEARIRLKATQGATVASFELFKDKAVLDCDMQISGYVGIQDSMVAPGVIAGLALIYVDGADGDLKVKFGDGTVKTIVTDT